MPSVSRRTVAAAFGLLLCCAALFLFSARHTYCFSRGNYLQGSSGSHILICEDGAPIVLNDRSRSSALFDRLTDGDRVLVLHDAALESYPARSAAYFCFRLGDGSRSDLPAHTLEELTQLGWLSASP